MLEMESTGTMFSCGETSMGRKTEGITKLPNQGDTITTAAFRGFVNVIFHLIRDLSIPEHCELHLPCLSHTVWPHCFRK